MSRSQKEKQQQKYPDLILSKAASNLLKLSQKEKTKKHKEAAKTLLSLHKKATKEKQQQRPDIFDLKAAELLQKVSKKAAKQAQQKEKTTRKRTHEQAAQSLLSLSAEPKPKKWKSRLIQKHQQQKKQQ
jgi:hypothetical protein